MIYLDYAATTPMSDEALATYTEVAKHYFANTMSLHDMGTKANDLLNFCREKLAQAIHGDPDGLYFTSGGSESNFLAIEGLTRGNRNKGNHIITSHGEHDSIINTFKRLETEGFDVTYIDRQNDGTVRFDDIMPHLKEETILVALGHVNSEVGAIQDIETIGGELFKKNILFHCDVVQSFGRLPIDVKSMHVSSLSISSHKIYGPKGVGACYIDPSLKWEPLLPNGSHEKGFRAGTVNVPGIASFITASEAIYKTMTNEFERMKELRKLFTESLDDLNLSFVIEGEEETTLPSTLAIRINKIEGQQLMLACNQLGLAIATGSACHSGHHAPSSTLIAMGRSKDEARELVRLSFGKWTTKEDIRYAARQFGEAVNRCSSHV
ncbi:aminotransferase class V-fold PLP-dependent enzyme [Terrilactibacillus sp. BCM23-1]|uniref:Aminotransferase class V-fold PLP-dependent enzyme n=1 Tax=Terrilactibacillus tamarindi TaxID=2599694 RepID=A0A6N8CP75_9BACI|nr:IscS subfamily cysteine desulfurase [Terrilactibacillus tamarindi]MTT30675.1 aminotransferase class V-fold PLP-dependent enzyme [Terrilactibacillus tamarindi]